MKILVINHYAGSDSLGMEYRPFYLGREWVAAGHAVTVIGAGYSHLRQHQPAPKADLETVVEEGVRFRWVRTGRYSGNGLGRIANIMTFVGKLTALADRIAREEKPDVVICSSTYPLDIYPGERIARKAGAKLVFEIHDLWPLTPILLGGFSPRHPYIRLMQMAEDRVCARADLVVSILPGTKSHMTARGLAPEKWVHVPNGVPIAAIERNASAELPAYAAELIAAERTRGRFLVGYAGGINPSNAIETIVEAAKLLAGEPVGFLLAGGGSGADAIGEQIAREGLGNLHLIGFLPKATVQPFLRSMDLLVMPWRRSPLYQFGISPNKLFDYMLAGRPIVQSLEASNDPVADAGAGMAVPPEDPAALAEAIRAMRRMTPSQRLELGRKGRQFVECNHDYRFLAAAFAASLSQAKVAPPHREPVARSASVARAGLGRNTECGGADD